MIKTLLIIGIATAILSVFVFAFIAYDVIFNVRSDEQVREFLNSPGAVEKFKNSEGNKTNRNESRSSPLVQQAEAFALYLNPPREKLSRNNSKNQGFSSIKPTSVPIVPKFIILGTSYCKNNPEISQVLIDEPGKGRHWVKQSDKVGHLLIEQVKDGIIVVKGGEETFELKIEKTQKGATVPKGISSISAKGIQNRPKLNLPKLNKEQTSDFSSTDDESLESEDISEEEETKLEDLVNKLKEVNHNDANDGTIDDEKVAKMEKLISKFKSSRVSAEEAKRLGNLGETLKDVQEDDPNKSVSNRNNSRIKLRQRKSKESAKI